MSIVIIIYLLVAGIVAGLLSTTAGLAYLVSYPVLLSIGLPPVSANVTNTTSAVFTGFGALFSSQKELKTSPQTTLTVITLTLVGSICGSFLLVTAPATTFEHLVPFLILAAGILMLVPKKNLTKEVGQEHAQSKPALFWKGLAILAVGIYIGYFGASAGMVLLAVLTVTIRQTFVVSNAIKNLATLTANLVAMLIYSFTAHIDWGAAIVMGAGFFIGGYLGPIVVRHVSAPLLRRLIAIGAFVLAGYFFTRPTCKKGAQLLFKNCEKEYVVMKKG